jgi:hypothetical protein
VNQRTFIVKTRSILTDNAGARKLPRQLSGKTIDAPRLALVPAGADRVFSRQVKRSYSDYHIVLLVDASGSMHINNRVYPASACAHALDYSLRQAGASIETVLFNREIYEVSPAIVQGALGKALFRHVDEIAGSRAGGGNHDHLGVNYAVKKLLRHPKPGKLLLVLSDGLPSCRGGGSCLGQDFCSDDDLLEKALMQSVKKARNQGIMTLSIGIQTASPTQFYGRRFSKAVYDLDGLYTACAGLIEKNIIRG